MNPDIPSSINQFDVIFDPYGFTSKRDWLRSAQKTEDILQIEHVYADGPIIDVGWYVDQYRVMVIKSADWDHPLEEYSSKDCDEVCRWLYLVMDRYGNG